MGQSGLQIHVLGELTVFDGGRRIEVPGSRKTRALLGYLLLQERPVTREHICELLWPLPDDPRAALRWSLTKLRPLLNPGPDHLEADRRTVAVTGMDENVDLLRIERRLRPPLDNVSTADLAAAADLFHGELLEGLEIPDCHRFNAWLVARSEAVRRLHRSVLANLTARLADQPDAALVHARTRVALDPLDESAHVDVVALLARLGRRAEADEQAARCRGILDTELGVEPGPELDKARRAAPQQRKVAADITPAPEPATVAPAREAGLFGRADECVRIEQFLTRAEGGVLFLEGESGIGKSRLLAEVEQRARNHGAPVLMGRSWEVGVVRPFGVWIDLLQDRADSPECRAALDALRPAADAAKAEMETIIGAVQDFVVALGRDGRPPVLVFDDLQWIDPASVTLLGALAPQVAAGQLAIACAGRPGEFADNDPARTLVRTWRRAGLFERLAIGPLPERDAAALARAFAPTANVGDAVAACGGNPLYLIESVRGGTDGAQRDVASLVADRLAVFDEATREIVDWAAIMGRAFPAARIGELLDRPLDELLRQAAVLERHGILRPHGSGWDFGHDLLRSTATGLISGPRRALMHRRVARLLAAQPGADGETAGEIVFHAGRGDLPELAARAAVTAGDRALAVAAFDDAWRVAERGRVAAATLEGNEAITVGVDLLRVQVLAGLGRRDPLDMVRSLLEMSRRAAAADLLPEVRTARWLLSIMAEEAGDFDQAQSHSLQAAEAGRRADPETRLKAAANTARCLLQLEREPDRAAALLDEATALSGELGLPVLDIPWGRGLLHLMRGQREDAHAALTEGAALAGDQGDHWARFECLSRLSMLDLATGDGAAVQARDTDLRAVAAKLGEGSELALTDTLLTLSRHRADDAATDRDLEAALDSLRAADSKGLLSYALNEAGRLDLAAGDLDRATARAEEAARAADDVGRRHQLTRALELFEKIETARQDDSPNRKKDP